MEISNNRLSELSQYATTDVSLVNFIKIHKTSLDANVGKYCQIANDV